jgi:glycosyltransferase involved in cell wall biosynthesis
MKLIVNRWGRHHVSHDDVAEFEAAILTDRRIQPAGPLNQYFLAALYYAWLGLRHLRRPSVSRKPAPLARDYFVVLMSLNPQKCMPYFLLPGRKSVYLFDAWPKFYPKIQSFIRDWGIQHAFVSSSQSTARLVELVEGCQFHWVPEGVTPQNYRQYPISARNIDVLQFGRRYELYHQQIVGALEKAGKTYLYEQAPGQIIFPDHSAFVDGLARARISICFPSNITHPERAGDVSTLTLRYLQSLASKCLVVGSAPEEMVRLFGYNPVIQADLQDPAGQLLSILENYDDFAELIEQNYRKVVTEHTWKQRWEQIAGQLL